MAPPTPAPLVTELTAPAYVFQNGTWELVLGEFPINSGQYYGDTIDDLGGRQVGESELLSFGGPPATVIGDSVGMSGRARGGDDAIDTSARGNTSIGDALVMHDRAVGGDDTIDATGAGVNVYGDASLMFDATRGGDDTITLTFAATAREAFGDAGEMSGRARGGDDLIVAEGNAITTILVGDAARLSDRARGGDDRLVAGVVSEFFGSEFSYLYGDGIELADHARGGDDVLVSGPDTDFMFGDAEVMAPTATGGRDTFVFLTGSGHDTVYDFTRGQDLLDVGAYGFDDISDLEIETADGSTVVHLGAEDSVTLVDVTGLSERDVLFA